MNPSAWKHNPALFLVEDQLRFTYGDFYEAVSAQIHRFSETSENTIILEAGNYFSSYTRFIGAMMAGKTVMLCSPAKARDHDYLSLLRQEMSKPNIFLPFETVAPPEKNGELIHQINGKFVVRTSGSSGPMFKLVLHQAERFIQKYKTIGPHFERTMAFSPAETIAGIETLLEVLTHEKTLITSKDDLTPEVLAGLIKEWKIDYFQTTPSYMNLLLVSKMVQPEFLGCLKKIAYGSEPSVSFVVQQFKKILPHIELVHTYGMSEIGIQKTITDQSEPTHFTLDEKFNSGRIIDGILHVRSMTKLLCYLNAVEEESPLGDEWFCTQDEAVVENGYLRVLGRKGDLINIGGRKFFPIEIEDIFRRMDDVSDVTITAEKNEMIGSVITATIVIPSERDESEFRKAYKQFCEKNLVSYMHPHRLKIVKDTTLTPRLKKMRKL